MTRGWAVLLNGVAITSCGVQEDAFCPEGVKVVGHLTSPPDGLGLPGLRTEDVTYPQRDGVRHFQDWYEPRILTLEVSVAEGDSSCGCAPCYDVRKTVQDIIVAWSRACDDEELVIFTDCDDGCDPDQPEGLASSLYGPFAMVGRPRVATVQWARGHKAADLVLRFDGVDERLWLTDDCGTPESGERCVTADPTTSGFNRCYGESGNTRCYDRCYDNPTGGVSPAATVEVYGTLCTCPTFTFHGPLTTPYVSDGINQIGYQGDIPAGQTVIIDGADGTARDAVGNDLTFLTTLGTFCVEPGTSEIRLFAGEGDGYVDICWRDSVASG